MAQDLGRDNDLLGDLTDAQREAVTHFEGPLLILAAAGSGKTRVITRRVAWLLRRGVRPSNILAITFTNKAAGEMRQRVEALVPDARLWISTFHSFGAKLLRIYADRLQMDRNFTIYDMDDRKKVIKDAMESTVRESARVTPDQIGAAISKAKNQLSLPERHPAYDYFTEIVSRVYAVYHRRMKESNAVDFDDLLLIPALALRHSEELRSELDHRFKFLLIDEYQDTNGAQYEIAKRLSVENRNICVVGDPDQSIYKFRGSDIRNILDFERDFPDAKTIALEKNYRSTKAILNAASVLIDHNQQRKKKALVTDNPQGQPVHALVFTDGLEEADRVASRIRDAVNGGKRRYRDYAVFLRTNALSRSLESAFIKYGIPYQMVRGLAFYERKENRDVLAYLRLLLNPKDDVSFLRAVNEPARGIGKVSLEHLRSFASPREMSLLEAAGKVAEIPAIKGKAALSLRDFHKLMQDLRPSIEKKPHEVVQEVIDRSGYGRMLKESHSEEDEERYENIEELVTGAEQFSRDDPSRTIGDFLETIALANDLDGWGEQQDWVSVMTLQAAKGLEFPVVNIMAVEQGILPHARSIDISEEIEEERRLCFVGMTRAKEELYLSRAQFREFGGQHKYTIESDFLIELPSEVERIDNTSGFGGHSALNYYRGSGGPAARQGWDDTGYSTRIRKPPVDEKGYFVGAIVEHDDYGMGKIKELSGFGANRMVRIIFVNGVKTFNLNHVKLTLIDSD